MPAIVSFGPVNYYASPSLNSQWSAMTSSDKYITILLAGVAVGAIAGGIAGLAGTVGESGLLGIIGGAARIDGLVNGAYVGATVGGAVGGVAAVGYTVTDKPKPLMCPKP